MRRLKHWLRKVWGFMGDDRLGLVVGVLLMNTGFGRVPEQDYLWALFDVALGLFVGVISWRGLGKQRQVEPMEVHP